MNNNYNLDKVSDCISCFFGLVDNVINYDYQLSFHCAYGDFSMAIFKKNNVFYVFENTRFDLLNFVFYGSSEIVCQSYNEAKNYCTIKLREYIKNN